MRVFQSSFPSAIDSFAMFTGKLATLLLGFVAVLQQVFKIECPVLCLAIRTTGLFSNTLSITSAA